MHRFGFVALSFLLIAGGCGSSTDTTEPDAEATTTTLPASTVASTVPTTVPLTTQATSAATTRATTAAPTTRATPAPTAGVFYANCSAVKAAGKAPRRGQPGYSTDLDRDGDGVACET